MGGSWQVLTWIAGVSAVLALFGVLYGYRFARRKGRSITSRRAIVVGSLTSLVCLGAFALSQLVPELKAFGLALAAIISLALPAAAIFLFSRPANPAFNRTSAGGASPGPTAAG